MGATLIQKTEKIIESIEYKDQNDFQTKFVEKIKKCEETLIENGGLIPITILE